MKIKFANFIFLLVFIFSSPVWANVNTLSDCSLPSVTKAISAATDGDSIICPSGNWTWSEKVTINKNIEFRGSGPDYTIITPVIGTAIVITGAKSFNINGFSFVGPSNQQYGFIQIASSGNGWRIHNCKFINGIPRNIWVGNETDMTYGLIDNNMFILSTSGSMQGISILGAGIASRKENFMAYLGTINAVYIENNIFDFNDRSDGAIDAGNAARFVFRHNLVKGTQIGMHGTDSGYRVGVAFYEIYENVFTGKAAGNAPLGAGYWIRSGTGVIYNNRISGIWNLGGCGEYFCFTNYRTFGPESWSGKCDGTKWKYTPPASLSLTGEYKFCSVTKDQICKVNSDCPYSETCSEFMDGSGLLGYPCRAQVGVGPNQTLEPVYMWNNINTDSNKILGAASVVDHIVIGRDVIVEKTRPGYSAYIFPHPLSKTIINKLPLVPSNIEIK